MKINRFESIIPKVNNVFFSPSFMMRGNNLKYITSDGEIVSINTSLRLYRNLRISNVLEIINNKTLQFDVPIRWNDPFEKLFYQKDVCCGVRKYYVVCLCFYYDAIQGEESMWNMHGHPIATLKEDEFVVRASFNILALCKSLAKANNELKFYIAPVDYSKSRVEILKTNQERKKKGYTAIHEFIEDMLLKRKAFSYEREIRLFAVSEQPFIINADFTHINLKNKTSDIVSSITLPPNMASYLHPTPKDYHQELERKGNLLKSYLRDNKYKNKIFISRLYDILA